MSWLILIGYLAGAVISWRSFAMGFLEHIERSFPNLDLTNLDRAMSAFIGTLLSLFWPVCLSVRFMYRVIVWRGVLHTPKEIRASEKAELEAYRKLARENNLPAPSLDID